MNISIPVDVKDCLLFAALDPQCKWPNVILHHPNSGKQKLTDPSLFMLEPFTRHLLHGQPFNHHMTGFACGLIVRRFSFRDSSSLTNIRLQNHSSPLAVHRPPFARVLASSKPSVQSTYQGDSGRCIPFLSSLPSLVASPWPRRQPEGSK